MMIDRTIDDVGLEDAGEILVEFAVRTCAQVAYYGGHCEGWYPGSGMVFDWNRGSKEGVIIQDLDDTVIRGQECVHRYYILSGADPFPLRHN